jgi:hypothetical protein
VECGPPCCSPPHCHSWTAAPHPIPAARVEMNQQASIRGCNPGRVTSTALGHSSPLCVSVSNCLGLAHCHAWGPNGVNAMRRGRQRSGICDEHFLQDVCSCCDRFKYHELWKIARTLRPSLLRALLCTLAASVPPAMNCCFTWQICSERPSRVCLFAAKLNLRPATERLTG